MELNAEQVKRGIECLENKIDRDCNNCSIYWKHARTPTVTRNCRHIILDDALALINSQEQRIKELAEKIKDLTETVEVRGKVVERLQILTNEIEEDNRKLTEENENLYRTLDDKIQEKQRLIEERDGFENLARTAIETQNRMSDTIE